MWEIWEAENQYLDPLCFWHHSPIWLRHISSNNLLVKTSLWSWFQILLSILHSTLICWNILNQNSTKAGLLNFTDIVLYIITVFGKNKKSLSNLQLDIKLKQFFHFQRTYFSCYNSGETKSIIIIFYLYFISMHFINNLFTTSCIV